MMFSVSKCFFAPPTHRSQRAHDTKRGQSFCCCALSRVARNKERQLYHDVLNNSAKIMLFLRIPAFVLCLPLIVRVHQVITRVCSRRLVEPAAESRLERCINAF